MQFDCARRNFIFVQRGIPGGGVDLEEEILLVAIPVSPTLDDLDGVVDAFRPSRSRGESIFPQAPGQ